MLLQPGGQALTISTRPTALRLQLESEVNSFDHQGLLDWPTASRRFARRKGRKIAEQTSAALAVGTLCTNDRCRPQTGIGRESVRIARKGDNFGRQCTN